MLLLQSTIPAQDLLDSCLQTHGQGTGRERSVHYVDWIRMHKT